LKEDAAMHHRQFRGFRAIGLARGSAGTRGPGGFAGIVVVLALAIWAVTRQEHSSPAPRVTPAPVAVAPRPHAVIPLPETEQRLCTAVAILVDTSGSMRDAVQDHDGRPRPKSDIAKEALARILEHTSQWQQANPDRVLQIGVSSFSSSVSPVLPMAPFDAKSVPDALQRLPRPAGGTAIGRALQVAFQSLYQSGCVRKYVVCITDGQNTSGPPADRVARQLYAQTAGEVELHFVAFDTSAGYFDFLNAVNGFAVEAADAPQLQQRLTDIYEKRILAEAMQAEKED